MGRGSLIDRLAAQVGSNSFAIALLKKRGDLTPSGELTAKGMQRNKMTAEERAIDRASKESGKSASEYTYDPTTNRATLK
ncbi:MAG: hypothetical protein H8E16_12015 [Flavobacteriales bacterium]|nr:hypothetical protein [Flavobacteriales bacterium]